MRTFIIALFIATFALVQIPSIASANALCDSYGVRCYKKLDDHKGLFLDRLFSPKGNYQGSVYLEDGNCYDWAGFCCQPCDKSLDGIDWDAKCNETFVECDGECFAD